MALHARGGLILLFNVARILLNENMTAVPASPLLLMLYPALSSVAYWLMRGDKAVEHWAQLLLAVGHLSAMTATSHLIDTPALVSVAWLLLASAELATMFKLRDRTLGQSSLLLFLLADLKIRLNEKGREFPAFFADRQDQSQLKAPPV